jgi:hypothetical protein
MMKHLLLIFGFALALTMGAPAIAQDTPPPTNEGAFDALSPGGQKIVSSIYDSHLDATAVSTTDTTAVSLTKDDIAAMKGDTGWGNTYKQLYEQGLVTHKNLGQAVSSYQRQNNPSSTVVTTGTGAQIVSSDKKGKGADASTVKGGNASSQGNGNKFGHSKNTVITTGAGGAVGAGATTHTSAGGSSFGGSGGAKGRGKGGASHKGR